MMPEVSTRYSLSSLELRIPPPIVALVAGMLMWPASRLAPWATVDVAGSPVIALCLAVTGIVVDVAGLISFRRVQTTVSPIKPGAATSLVIAGLYKYTRNPMYVGLLLVLVGWASYLSNALGFAMVPLAALYLTRFQIIPEERALARKFGADYADYQGRVRRWL